jgi:hypothetical protein
MSETPRHADDRSPADRTPDQPDAAITDLPEQVRREEAEKVRGGLNPQPLPPRIAPPI